MAKKLGHVKRTFFRLMMKNRQSIILELPWLLSLGFFNAHHTSIILHDTLYS